MDEQTYDMPTTGTPSIEVSRNAKGDYSWKIKIYNEDVAKMLEEINKADQSLMRSYGGENNG